MEDINVAAEMRVRLAERIGQHRFELWFGPHTKFSLGERGLTVLTSCTFTRDWLRANFSNDVRACCQAVTGHDVHVAFEADADDSPVANHLGSCAAVEQVSSSVVLDRASPTQTAASCVNSSGGAATPRGRRQAAKAPAERRDDTKQIRREPTLSGFVVGKTNEYAFGAADMTARGQQQASPVLFCGTTGVGKTHLLRSIRAEYRRRQPRARAVYLTAEQFVTGYVEALRGSGLPSFRQKCRGADLFLLDDVQFFAGKRASLEELVHTLDCVLAEGRQLVLASDRSLAELRPLGRELVSRLAGGLVCEIEPPDFATRQGIVRQLSGELGIAIGEDVASLVAVEITSGARELRGALHRLQAMSVALERPISRELAASMLVDLAQQCVRTVRLSDVEHAVCDVFGVEPAQLRSERKSRSVHEPRMLAMWLARKYTRAPWSEIGQFFGRRSHSTVISAHRRVEQLIRSQSRIGVSDQTCGVEEAIRRVEAALRTA